MKVFFYLVLIAFLFYSCDEKEVPEILNLEIAVSDTLRNEAEVSVEIPDSLNISQIEVYANDSLVFTSSSGPYQFLLNTLNLKEGGCELKAIAYKNNGQKQESLTTVFIQNALLHFKSDLLYVNPGSYLLVTDTDGNILNYIKINNEMEQDVLPKQNFEKNNVHVFYIVKDETFSNFNITGFLNIRRGANWRMINTFSSSNLNNVFFHLKNVPEFTSIDLSTNNYRRTLTNLESDTTGGLEFSYSEGTNAYVEIEKPGGVFYKIIDLNNQSSINIDISEVTDIPIVKSIPLPDNDRASYFIYAIKDDPDYGHVLKEKTIYNKTSLDLHYPQDYYLKYVTGIDVRTPDGKTYSHIHKDYHMEDFELMNASADLVNSSLDNFEITIQGNVDDYKCTFIEKVNFNRIEINGPVSWTTFRFPDIQILEEFNNFKLEGFEPQEIILSDYENYEEDSRYFKFFYNYPSIEGSQETKRVRIPFN